MAEKESYIKFTTIIDQIFETIDEQDFVPTTNGLLAHSFKAS